MSDVWGENLPILYGRSVATGELVHVGDARKLAKRMDGK